MRTKMQMKTVRADEFTPHIGSEFLLESGGGEVHLTLTEAAPRGRDNAAGRPFGLLFSGPPTPALPQQTYALTQDSLGEMEIFLVPIGDDGGRRVYEAIFT